MVEKRYGEGGSYKIKLEAEWEEHAGKEATEWYLAGYNSLNIKSNLLFPRALGETIRFKKRSPIMFSLAGSQR